MSHISENTYIRHVTEESLKEAKQRLEEELSFGRVKMMVMNTKQVTGVYFVSKDWVVSELIKALQIESVHKIACLYSNTHSATSYLVDGLPVTEDILGIRLFGCHRFSISRCRLLG